MTTYTTRTEEFGKVTFTAPAATDDYAGYVWIETERGFPAKDRKQICHGGDFSGSTVQEKAADVKAAAQKWLRQRREWMANA